MSFKIKLDDVNYRQLKLQKFKYGSIGLILSNFVDCALTN